MPSTSRSSSTRPTTAWSWPSSSRSAKCTRARGGGCRRGPAPVVIVKHTNPCGAARAPRLLEAYKLARDADPVSAFGGIVALSQPVDAATGAALAETFLEAVIAPSFDQGALDALRSKKSLRLLEVP